MLKIPIVFSTNDKFADLCSTAIWSIIQNGSYNNFYDIYIFYTRLSKDNIEKLEKNDRKNVSIKCIDITKHINFDDLYEIDNYTYEIYYRYYASKILNYDKIIYLDSDIIVLEDVAVLYNEDIQNMPIAAIKDFISYLDKKQQFNSGVLLINSKKFEELKIREQCIELLKNNKFDFPDQCALNIVCKDNIKLLNTKYNYQINLANYHKFKKEIRKRKFREEFREEPVIVHFTYITKPYEGIYTKYDKEFWEYAKLTPYYEQLIEKLIKDIYNVIKKSSVEDIYIEMTEEGKVGLKKILEVFIYQIKYWFLYKIRKDKG